MQSVHVGTTDVVNGTLNTKLEFHHDTKIALPMMGPNANDVAPVSNMFNPFAAGNFSRLTYFGIITDWYTAFIPFANPIKQTHTKIVDLDE
mgnify:FL=1